MRRVNRLLLDLRKTIASNTLLPHLAIISKTKDDKWELIFDLWNGKSPPNDKSVRIIREYNALEEAQAGCDDIAAEYLNGVDCITRKFPVIIDSI